jgi:hypothetical protein
MVRGTYESEQAARRSPEVVAAIATGLLIVLVTGMEAQTRGSAIQAGSIGQPLAGEAVLSNGVTSQQLVDRLSRGAWDTFRARIAVRRQVVAADGSPVGLAAMTTEYTWERTKTASGWKTTMTMVGAPRVRVQARTGPVTLPAAPTVVKTEDLGDGSAPRFWDVNGAEIKMPSAVKQARVMGPAATGLGASMAEEVLAGAHGVGTVPPGGTTDWIDAIIMPDAMRMQRLSAFDRQFGRRRGVVRGLSRHLRQQSDGEREVLVDEEVGVPVEANLVATNGELVAHSTFAYERAASGAVLRRGVRTERMLSGSNGTRIVTEVSFSDITVEQRGGAR